MAQPLFFRMTLFFYFLGCLLFLLNLRDRRAVIPPDHALPLPEPHGQRLSLPISQRLALITTGAGFLAHTATLGIQLTTVPFRNPHEAISFFAWVLVLVFFIVEIRYKIYVMGSFILPIVFLFLLSVANLPYQNTPIIPTLKSALLGVHTTLSLLGIVAFAMAAIAGMMYLLQERFLKSKQFHPLGDKLPPLDLLDQWNKNALLWGFPLLTVGMIAGALWSQYTLGSFWSSNNTKQMLAIGAWFFYFIVLQGRITIGWRARRAAHLAIFGFVGVILIFVTLSG